MPTPSEMADRLVAARERGDTVRSQDVCPADRPAAYAVQEATVAGLGAAVGGWKVGGPSPEAELAAAPCLASGIRPDGARLTGPEWRLRGVELEVGLRLGRDLLPGGRTRTQQELAAAVEALVPIIEIVETRLSDFDDADPMAKLADMQSHGALIVGEPSRLDPARLDMREVVARLRFDGQNAADTRGGNPAWDIWRSLAWLAIHCEARGRPLRAGEIVTTGSCTGMLFVAAGTLVEGEAEGIGTVRMQF